MQPRFNHPVLLEKQRHIRDQVLDDVHMRQRINFHRSAPRRNLTTLKKKRQFLKSTFEVIRMENVPQARELVRSVDIHGARSTNTFATRPPEREGWIDFVFDFD